MDRTGTYHIRPNSYPEVAIGRVLVFSLVCKLLICPTTRRYNGSMNGVIEIWEFRGVKDNIRASNIVVECLACRW